jgi:hypothetical protein
MRLLKLLMGNSYQTASIINKLFDMKNRIYNEGRD